MAGILQGLLLIMCICWLIRQRRLGIDDFGNPIDPLPESPIGVAIVPDEGAPVEVAVDDAVDSDVRYDSGEQTPLLSTKQDERRTGLWTWLGGGMGK